MDYVAPTLLRNGHLLSIYPSLWRKVATQHFERERITTADGDFLDLDWSRCGARRLVVISHGLEGHSRRPYVAGMARAANAFGWDALAWNYRSCGGEMNRKLRFYHSGETQDLREVIAHARAQGLYDEVALIGFSMGGNMSLVYLGEAGAKLDSAISKAVVFSVPCDLAASATQLTRPANYLYLSRFMRSLRTKMQLKHQQYPDQIDIARLDKVRTFKQFDDRFTAPLHGFNDAEDYWRRCSSKFFIGNIQIPTLIVNAANDPFLAPDCFPVAEVKANRRVKLEVPVSGGHVGFVSFNRNDLYWSEQRAFRFLNEGS